MERLRAVPVVAPMAGASAAQPDARRPAITVEGPDHVTSGQYDGNTITLPRAPWEGERWLDLDGGASAGSSGYGSPSGHVTRYELGWDTDGEHVITIRTGATVVRKTVVVTFDPGSFPSIGEEVTRAGVWSASVGHVRCTAVLTRGGEYPVSMTLTDYSEAPSLNLTITRQ
jgi:hypothetical protein